MPGTRPKAQLLAWLMACLRAGLAFSIVAGLVGCSSLSDGLSIFAPYRRSTQPEEYRSPPAQDARFTDPPTYPSHLLKPVVKVKDDNSEKPRNSFGPGGPMTAPGGY